MNSTAFFWKGKTNTGTENGDLRVAEYFMPYGNAIQANSSYSIYQSYFTHLLNQVKIPHVPMNKIALSDVQGQMLYAFLKGSDSSSKSLF